MNGEPGAISRRSWLVGSLAMAALGASRDPKDPKIEAIRAQGKKAGMEGFDESESQNYRGVGDAPKRFREEALAICEAVLADYRKQFGDKGFQLAEPKEKLTVVILMGPKSYAAFEGGFIGDVIGGHYDLEENRLVMFDSRGPGSDPRNPVAEQANTFTLVHETVHQLTFNTGLLELKSDVPLCVSEGLATYCETWRPRHKGDLGGINTWRRKGFEDARRQGVKWIGLATLLADDKPFSDEKLQQMAYAESWMFVYKMLRDKARLPQFRAYLEALRKHPDPANRVALASECLGDLDKIDKEIRSAR